MVYVTCAQRKTAATAVHRTLLPPPPGRHAHQPLLLAHHRLAAPIAYSDLGPVASVAYRMINDLTVVIRHPQQETRAKSRSPSSMVKTRNKLLLRAREKEREAPVARKAAHTSETQRRGGGSTAGPGNPLLLLTTRSFVNFSLFPCNLGQHC